MDRIVPPEYVQRVLRRIRKAGFEVCPVGGCVRDLALSLRPHDWDLCTSALPEELLDLFPAAIPTGIKHGTVTVKSGGKLLEITTFRADGDYADHRRPESVRFVRSLRDDLSRRDFTVNAMALDADGGVIDLFGGLSDAEARVLRCVGEPSLRFEEDALRMLRALRFAARLGFAIEEKTLAAMREKAPLASTLAPERVRGELERILLSPRPEIFSLAQSLGLLTVYLSPARLDERALRRLGRLLKRAPLRWTGLCLILRGCGAIESAEDFLGALRMETKTIRLAASVASLWDGAAPETGTDWKRLLRRVGPEAAEGYARCRDALEGGKNLCALRAVLDGGEPWALKSLAVNGRTLAALGFRGEEIGRALYALLDRVIENPEDNTEQTLTALAAKYREGLWTPGRA